MQLHEMLKQELASVEKEWLEAKKARTEAENRETLLRGKVNAIRGALVAVTPSEDSRAANVAQIAQPTAEVLTANENGHRNTTQFIRDLINQRAGEGITAVEIWKEIEKAQIDVARNYIYAVLAREVAKRAIVQKDHRYFPSPLESLREPGSALKSRTGQPV